MPRGTKFSYFSIILEQKNKKFLASSGCVKATIDYEINSDPYLSGLVLGKLDACGDQLILSVEKNGHCHQEVLMEGVKASWEFFSPETGRIKLWEEEQLLPAYAHLTLEFGNGEREEWSFEIRRSWKREFPKVV